MKSIHIAKKVYADQEFLKLQAQLAVAREDLRLAYLRFDQVVDNDLIDACIYQMNAALAQCNYLVRAIKARTPEESIAATSTKEQGVWI